MKKLLYIMIAVVAVLGVIAFFILMFPKDSEATFNPQITICHVISNPDLTLSINLNALGAHLAHGDHIGACVTPSPTPTPEPTEEPTPTPEPTREPEATPSSQGLSEAGAYVCPDTSPTRAPANFHIYRNGNLVQVKWLPDNPKEGDQAIRSEEHTS